MSMKSLVDLMGRQDSGGAGASSVSDRVSDRELLGGSLLWLPPVLLFSSIRRSLGAYDKPYPPDLEVDLLVTKDNRVDQGWRTPREISDIGWPVSQDHSHYLPDPTPCSSPVSCPPSVFLPRLSLDNVDYLGGLTIPLATSNELDEPAGSTTTAGNVFIGGPSTLTCSASSSHPDRLPTAASSPMNNLPTPQCKSVKGKLH